jgi:lipopolysaccharide export system permease protein
MFLFMFLYVIVDIFSQLDEILRNKVPMGLLLQYYSSFMPIIFVQTVPIAGLLATVYMLSVLNKNNELTAAKACGISVNRLLVPVFILAIILGLASFIVNETFVPSGMITAEKIKTEYIKAGYGGPKKIDLIKNLTFYGTGNQLIYAQEFSTETNTLTGIIIIERGKANRLKRKILARQASWIDDKWVFYDCIIYRFDSLGRASGNPLVFKEKIIQLLETPEKIQRYEFQTEYMSYKELKGHIDRLSGSNPKILNSLKTDLHFKTALPFVVIIIMLLGIPFALSTKRGGAMSGIGISVLVGLIYYGSIYFVLAVGKGGIIPPIIAAHLSNSLFLLIAIILLRRCQG